MNIIPLLLKEYDQEAQITRKMLAIVPADKLDWKPHPKSMTMRQLAVHLAEIPSWPAMMLVAHELDFAAQPYNPTPAESAGDLLQILEKSAASGKETLGKTNEDDLWQNWTLRNGDHIIMVMTRYEAVRHAFSQQTHHRAQLGVYLRLLDIPIPGSYGPSADEMGF